MAAGRFWPATKAVSVIAADSAAAWPPPPPPTPPPAPFFSPHICTPPPCLLPPPIAAPRRPYGRAIPRDVFPDPPPGESWTLNRRPPTLSPRCRCPCALRPAPCPFRVPPLAPHLLPAACWLLPAASAYALYFRLLPVAPRPGLSRVGVSPEAYPGPTPP
ncbi:protein TRACHEARY ELEMENT DIFFERENTIATION-RELATED 7A-like [Schistocerca piceifrons]|uniref:protein TRACHEARY ELEMENT DIFFERENTIATION-RELATED 7A-like n=1 Tax=Schistocerca piceifrons TaxID=274613 RepID=UPI001F5F8185|nr:protein TRACHEARY ELEMENT DIFFERENTIATION-RELATED 7A-like [Schistocerca piceifrons]